MSFNEEWFKRLEEVGVLRNEMASLGWALWPKDMAGNIMGYFDEQSLRQLADEIERRNKPFWDEYEKWSKEQEKDDDRTRVPLPDGKMEAEGLSFGGEPELL